MRRRRRRKKPTPLLTPLPSFQPPGRSSTLTLGGSSPPEK